MFLKKYVFLLTLVAMFVASPAAQANKQMDTEDKVSVLVKALEKKDTKAVKQAIKAIGAYGKDAAIAIPELLKVLKDRPTLSVYTGTFGLAPIGEKIIAPLLPLLPHKNKNVRLGAATALKTLGAKSATKQLLPYLNTKDQAVQNILVGLLAHSPPASLPNMLKSAKKSKALRLAVIRIFGAMGQKASHKAIDYLRRSLMDKDKQVQQHALTSLGQIGDKAGAAVAVLLIFFQPSYGALRTQAIDTLVKIGRPSLPTMLEVLGHGNASFREAGLTVIGRVGVSTPRITRALNSMLKDRDGKVQKAAKQALARLNKKATTQKAPTKR